MFYFNLVKKSIQEEQAFFGSDVRGLTGSWGRFRTFP